MLLLHASSRSTSSNPYNLSVGTWNGEKKLYMSNAKGESVVVLDMDKGYLRTVQLGFCSSGAALSPDGLLCVLLPADVTDWSARTVEMLYP